MHNIVLRGIFTVAAGSLILLSGRTAPAYTEVEGAADAGLPEMVVEAENQVRQDIHKTRFDFPLSAAVIDTFYVPADEQLLSVSPVQGLVPFLNNPEPLSSEQVPHYWYKEPATTPVATFYPEDPEGHKARSWGLTVTDYRGSTFRTFGKKGEPPRDVKWDGRGDNGSMMQAGYPYSYVFSVTDKGTNTYNYAGTSFRIPAVDYMEDTERRLDFSGDQVFKRDAPNLSDDGEGWLVTAADRIRKDHPYSPLKVVVQAETIGLAEKRAELVAEYLVEQMILAEDWIETEAEARPDLRSEMDGSVSIRVAHAERSRR
jgi:hypothetical protein